MGLTHPRVCKLQNSSNPMFDANLALTPNIRLILSLAPVSSRLLLLWPGTVRINPALDLRQPLLVFVHHANHTHHTAYHNRNDRHQQSTQSKNALDESFHAQPSADLAIDSRFSGGADRDRTGGLLVANQALSQLSYSPTSVSCFSFPVSSKLRDSSPHRSKPETRNLILVGLDRLELSTSPLSGVRSSHLSYRPGFPIVRPEPGDAWLLAPSR